MLLTRELRAAIVVAAVCVGVAFVLMARRAADAPATADIAVIESYTLMATQGTLNLGAYSRFQWHHPGPFYFFLLAPFYAVSGDKTTGLTAGAAALALGCSVLIVMVLSRRRPALAAATASLLALYAWRAADAATSPWNPHVTVLPVAAVIIVAADVMAGNAVMLPLVALLASLAGQAHIALMPTVLAIGAVAFGRGVQGAALGNDRPRWRRALLWTLAAIVLAWALPAYEQLTGKPRGNLTELWQFFLHHAANGQPLRVAVSAWSDMLVGLLRPDFYVAQGWLFVESPVLWAEWLSLVLLALLGLAALRSLQRRDWFITALTGLLATASVVSLWSATRIEDRIFDHDVFWVVGLGILMLAVALDSIASAIGERTRLPAASLVWQVAAFLFVAAAAVPMFTAVRRAVDRSYEPPTDAVIARALAADVEAFMRQDHVKRPLIKIDQDAWGYVAGAVLDLQKRGTLVSFEEDWVVMFTPEFRITGSEDAEITFAMPPEHLRLQQQGARLISSHEPVYAHVTRK